MKSKLFVLLVLTVVSSALAGGGVWFGDAANGHSWNSTGAWENGVPTAADDAYVVSSWAGVNGPVLLPGDTAGVAKTLFVGWNSFNAGPVVLNIQGSSLDVTDTYMGYGAGAVGIMNISGGSFDASGYLVFGNGGPATINQMGSSSVECGKLIFNNGNAAGVITTYNLDAGTLNIVDDSEFTMNTDSLLNIEEGVLTIAGDVASRIGDYEVLSRITAYGGTGTLNYDYNVTNAGVTTVWAEVPEPATMAILALGSLIAIRRKK